MQTQTPVVLYDTQLLAEDMAANGMNKLDVAAKAGVSDMTVIRFLRGERQTAPTLKKIATALNHEPERYIVRMPRPLAQRRA